jgi:hypothetical protein
MIKILFYALLTYAVGMLISPAFATGRDNTNNYYDITNNYYQNVIESECSERPCPGMKVTSGVSDSDISRGIALAGAVNHQFTFDTLRMQGSVVGAVYDSEQAISFGLAKRFDSIDALWHGSVSVPDGGSDELVNFGATFRF